MGGDFCFWEHDEWHDSWRAGCGQDFVFMAGGGPGEHGFIFCPFCGKMIAIKLE